MAAENPIVRDFIIPIDRYPHLRETQTLSDAVQVLMSHTCGENEYLRYAGILVLNEKNQLVGGLNLQDILRALDKRFALPKGHEGKAGEYPNLAILWEDSFFHKCSEKKDIAISDFMVPTKKIVKGDDPLLKALSIMLHGNEVVLPVKEEGSIIGVIRLEEIFLALCGVCKL
nr:CBS domain-containing protein [Desulfobulbaceae bacterium]